MPLSREIIDRTLATKQGNAAYDAVVKLNDAGYETWWVGGCVRDMSLGNIPVDIDIATSAEPDHIKRLFPKHDAASEQYGSIVVSNSGMVFEITTFREDDCASDGRHPGNIAFTEDKAKDANRRDITVNALYWHPLSGELFDPFDGEKDLNEKLVRIIGEPGKRIEHDALRLLRVVRFRAHMAGQYHPDTFRALHEKSKLARILSGTRCFNEMEKMLLGPHPEIAFEDLWETDIIEHLIPELHACKGIAQPSYLHPEGDVWNHTMRLLSSFTDDHAKDVRWAGLLHDVGKSSTFSISDDRIHFNEHATAGAEIAKNILNRLQCSAKRRDKISWLIKHHMMMTTFLEINNKRKFHWYYHPWFTELLQVFWLDVTGTKNSSTDLYDRIVSDYNKFLDSNPRPKKPLLSGDDVMKILGIDSGEEVGEVLSLLHEKQISKAINTKAEATAYVKTLKK